jgi:hypothetical protein
MSTLNKANDINCGLCVLQVIGPPSTPVNLLDCHISYVSSVTVSVAKVFTLPTVVHDTIVWDGISLFPKSGT